MVTVAFSMGISCPVAVTLICKFPSKVSGINTPKSLFSNHTLEKRHKWKIAIKCLSMSICKRVMKVAKSRRKMVY